MTIRDIINQLELQGNVKIVYWADDECTTLFDDNMDNINYKSHFLERNIEYMYCADNKMVIEVENVE